MWYLPWAQEFLTSSLTLAAVFLTESGKQEARARTFSRVPLSAVSIVRFLVLLNSLKY